MRHSCLTCALLLITTLSFAQLGTSSDPQFEAGKKAYNDKNCVEALKNLKAYRDKHKQQFAANPNDANVKLINNMIATCEKSMDSKPPVNKTTKSTAKSKQEDPTKQIEVNRTRVNEATNKDKLNQTRQRKN